MTDAYDDLDPSRLAIDADDFHPNAAGHARLARRLDGALSDLPELASLWKPSPDKVHRANRTSTQDVVSALGRGKKLKSRGSADKLAGRPR